MRRLVGPERSGLWMEAASEVLGEPSLASARARLATALLESTGLGLAARVHLEPDGAASWYLAGPGPDPGTEAQMPASRIVSGHPFHGFHVGQGVVTPARLVDVVAAGWPMPVVVLEASERLGVPQHQLSVPVEPPGPAVGYDGWVLVDEHPVSSRALHTVTCLQPLLSGLDRHLRLIGDLVPPCSPASVRMTPREVLVLGMLAQGCTVQAIARRLRISPRTVHKHLEHLYRKLGAADRLSAVMRAQRLGLLDPRATPPGP